MLKNMYQGTNFCIKTDNGLTEYFESNSGVLQGCNLSPTLSNTFQNDLHESFDMDSDPLYLTSEDMITSLSWADDLILLSSSKEGF